MDTNFSTGVQAGNNKHENNNDNNRRRNSRKPACTRVYLKSPSLTESAGYTRDLSAGGVFVETSAAHELRIGEELTIVFALQLGPVTRMREFAARVVRITSEGVALTLRQQDGSAAPQSAVPASGQVIHLSRRKA